MNSKNELEFPPTKSNCPDYYVKNTVTGECEDLNELFNHDSKPECETVDFNDESSFPNLNNTGTGANSAICEKKKWAERCGLNWDGITNNENICYSFYIYISLYIHLQKSFLFSK